MTPKQLLVLHVEDNEADSELVLLELRRGGYKVVSRRVETETQLRSALEDGPWDVLIADYSLPNYDAPSALLLTQRLCPDLPFVVVSGTIGEDTAVAVMRGGADDYLMKDNLARLVPAVENALDKARLRCEQRQAKAASHENIEQLRRSEARFRAVFDASAVGIAVTAMDGTHLDCNAVLLDTLGLTRDDFLGLKDEDLTHPDDRNPDPTPWCELLAGTRNSYQRDTRFVRPDGQVVFVRLTVSLATYGPDNETAAITMAENITKRTLAERALRETTELMQLIVRNDPNALAVFDRDMRYLAVSDRYLVEYDVKDKDVLGRHHYEVFPEIPERWREVHTRCLAGAVECSDDDHFRRPDGTTTYTRWECRPWYTTSGEIGGIITYTEVTTARKLAEQALQESEQRFRLLYEEAPMPYQSLDGDGCFLEANPCWLHTLGYERDEVIGKPFTSFLVPGQHSLFEAHFAQFMQDGLPTGIEWELVRKDGSTVLALFASRVNHHPDEGFRQTHSVFQDVTESRKAQAESLRAQKLESVGILAGGIAHDFNNALLVAIGNLQMARLYPVATEKHALQLHNAERACLQARDLTKQLLTFAKGGEPIKQTARIAELVRDTALFALSGSNVRCEFDLDAECSAVNADLGQINQVVNNLVINADQAMASGGILHIGVGNVTLEGTSIPLPPGAYVRITVKDEGQGIPPEHLDRIFDPYFTTKSSGHGLGLASCYSIIRNHGGHTGVESSPSGTIFTIHLPSCEEPLKTEDQQDQTIPTGNERVLVMDDEQAVQEFARMVLEELGYTVGVAGDVAETLSLYQTARDEGRPYAAVILDLTIRGGPGGKEAIQQLMTLDPQVRAIVCSGYSADAVMANYRKHGFKAVVVKPYEVIDLARAVRHVLDETQDAGT